MSDSLVVQSKVREFFKNSGELRMSSDSIDALNKSVEEVLKRAIDRAKGNDRKTIRPVDF